MSEALSPLPPASAPRQSDTQHRILPAILAARRSFETVRRDASAAPEDGGRPYRYATLAAHFDAVDDALLTAGLFVEQDILSMAGGTRLVTRIVHAESGEWRAGWLPLPSMPRDLKDYGAMLTYGRRYGLAMLLGLAPEDGNEEPRATTWVDHGPMIVNGSADDFRAAVERQEAEEAPPPEPPPPLEPPPPPEAPPEPAPQPARPPSVNGVVKALIAAAKAADEEGGIGRARVWADHGTFLRSLSSTTLMAVGDRWRATFGEEAPALPEAPTDAG